jgi:ferritin-like metal-binding protein YciE
MPATKEYDMKTEIDRYETGNSKFMEFFIFQLLDIYWAERKLVRTLPKWHEAATNLELKTTFRQHLEETRNHVTRLEHLFGVLGRLVVQQKCPAMAGIIAEGNDVIEETDTASSQRDVALIFVGQKAEHYEIASYSGLLLLARFLDQSIAAGLLEQTLAEEKKADIRLTMIAETKVNINAVHEFAS